MDEGKGFPTGWFNPLSLMISVESELAGISLQNYLDATVAEGD
jgi:hypothetical protein